MTEAGQARKRTQIVVAGGAALALVLAAVVGFVALERSRQTPTTARLSPSVPPLVKQISSGLAPRLPLCFLRAPRKLKP